MSITPKARADFFVPSEIVHLLIRVSGTVQGVGFRPFVYAMAHAHRLAGSVLNNNRGVLIHAEGPRQPLDAFLDDLRHRAPAAARVERVDVEELPVTGLTSFEILPSVALANGFTFIPPDLALCHDCRRELDDPRNRRHRYPFINCIQCGPRFTIVRQLPYDRPQTTMSAFRMCPACRAEYEDPRDRRFHTQPVCCRDCGPQLSFLAATPNGWTREETGESALERTAQALANRRMALLHGIGGFHLACDARDEQLVRELRRRKRRDEKPLAVMYPSIESLARDCLITETERDLLRSVRAPIVLLRKREACAVAPCVARENPFLGAMLPYSPLHLLLLRQLDRPIVLTSANLSDEPIAYHPDDALTRLHGIADVALVHNRDLHTFADDSVVRVIHDEPRIWRRSRGYVPEAIRVSEPFRRHTLAFGPQMKNTFCLGRESIALLSQHLGDMDTEPAIVAQKAALEHFLPLLDARVELAACDLHPDYATTRLAEAWCAARGIPLVRVQHHHAHMIACLAENGVTERAIGITLDGTGYGTDGTIWGGEVLVGDAAEFTRVAGLEPVPMLGGERAAREPWRMAVAWLHHTFGARWTELAIPFVHEARAVVGDEALNTLTRPAVSQSFPLTSSLGRLFDAVAAILFFGTRSQYEGQAAMQLEWRMSPDSVEPYPLERSRQGDGWIISASPMFRRLIEDVTNHIPVDIAARRFHEGVVAAFVQTVERIREETGLNIVALSGGCFQNAFLEATMRSQLEARSFRVILHHHVPTNDGGVSLGQAVIANAMRE